LNGSVGAHPVHSTAAHRGLPSPLKLSANGRGIPDDFVPPVVRPMSCDERRFLHDLLILYGLPAKSPTISGPNSGNFITQK
jgi:hypothetical protein